MQRTPIEVEDATIYLYRKYDLACRIWFNTK